MTVYVDDSQIPATVPNDRARHSSQWSHLFADTEAELHAFAARLGLRRSYFQPGRPLADKPSPFWHYDVTAGKRMQAIRLGAQPVSWRDSARIIREREARNCQAQAGREGSPGQGARSRPLPARPRRPTPLRDELDARLRAAGIPADDPGLVTIARWNAALGIRPQRGAERPEPEPGS